MPYIIKKLNEILCDTKGKTIDDAPNDSIMRFGRLPEVKEYIKEHRPDCEFEFMSTKRIESVVLDAAEYTTALALQSVFLVDYE